MATAVANIRDLKQFRNLKPKPAGGWKAGDIISDDPEIRVMMTAHDVKSALELMRG